LTSKSRPPRFTVTGAFGWILAINENDYHPAIAAKSIDIPLRE
jgi:hypothetical protein